jgi:hypothetical protein
MERTAVEMRVSVVLNAGRQRLSGYVTPDRSRSTRPGAAREIVLERDRCYEMAGSTLTPCKVFRSTLCALTSIITSAAQLTYLARRDGTS